MGDQRLGLDGLAVERLVGALIVHLVDRRLSLEPKPHLHRLLLEVGLRQRQRRRRTLGYVDLLF
jgi:hypothetical protein